MEQNLSILNLPYYLWCRGILSISTVELYIAGIQVRRVIFLRYVTTMLVLATSLVDLTNGLELIFGLLRKIRYQSTSWR